MDIMFTKNINRFQTFQFTLIGLFISALTAIPAWCAPTVDDIYTAADLSGVQGKLIAFFLLLVGGCLAVAAYRIAKKVISRMGSLG